MDAQAVGLSRRSLGLSNGEGAGEDGQINIKLKTGGSRPALLNGVQPETVLGILIAGTVFAEAGLTMTLTSVTDGADWRSPGSLHLPGMAFDIRVWDLPTEQDRAKMVFKLKEALGREFDVVDEGDHIHVELDPK